MYYVYRLESLIDSIKVYVGFTTDIQKRLKAHNNGQNTHTSKYKPWKIINYIAFENEEKARDFEKYLKTGSGRAFSKKHF